MRPLLTVFRKTWTRARGFSDTVSSWAGTPPATLDLVTSPTLLGRVSDWRDQIAWNDFDRRYRPWIMELCRQKGLSPVDTDEVGQSVMIELARRLQTFTYDPSRSFRGWLRIVVERRVIDFHRGHGTQPATLGDAADHLVAAPLTVEDETASPADDALRELATQVQAQVRSRIKNEKNWQAFWMADIEGESLPDVARQLGLKYTAAYKARERARKMLAEEGEKVLGPRLMRQFNTPPSRPKPT